MAYADQTVSQPLNPRGLGGALLINGAIIAGILVMNQNVTGKTPDGPTKIIDIFTPAPSQPVKQEKQPEHRAEHPRDTPQPLIPPEQPVDHSLIKGGGIITEGGGGTGIGTGPIIEPFIPPPPDPVLTGARLNPRYAGDLQPEYPPGLIRQEIEGAVTVRVLVGVDGRVKQVELIRSDQADFFKATRDQALRKWRFLPATRDGVPVESWQEKTVRFQMPD